MKKKHLLPVIIVAAVLLLVGGGLFIVREQTLPIKEPVRINIPEGTDYQALVDSLDSHGCIPSHPAFHAIARFRGLQNHIRPGSYLLTPNTHIIRVIQKIYSGNQDPVRVTINKHRTVQHLCQYLGTRLTLQPDSLLSLMQSDETCARYGETPLTIIGLFLQNTYELYWTTSPTALLDRMKRESDYFWDKRKLQLEALGLTRQQVLTIASIVEEETNADDEKADIASVYLNRYRIGMPLQADPTVKYAIGDFSIRRIRGNMLQYDSPYNTYRYPGLPPGPICIPSTASIDAVLKNKKTDYLFFCAKEDFSGRHNFAATSTEHSSNAQKFHKALNNRNIH